MDNLDEERGGEEENNVDLSTQPDPFSLGGRVGPGLGGGGE